MNPSHLAQPRCRRGAVARTLMAGTAVVLAGALSACGGSSGSPGTQEPSLEEEAVLTHVHGLGIDPRDGTLYAASHFGVFRIEDGRATQIADRWQDTMAFTVTGDGTFLGSGHPDLREDLPAHLGLIESTDAAQTWSPVSLAGEADFHALEVAGTNLFGYDALTGRLLVTADRESWDPVAAAQVVDLAWLGGDPDTVLTTSPRGALVEYETSGRSHEHPSAPQVVFIDSPAPGELVGITADGKVYSFSDPEEQWSAAPEAVPGAPEALEATSQGWYAASDSGIYRSTDRGESWEQVFAAAEHTYH